MIFLELCSRTRWGFHPDEDFFSLMGPSEGWEFHFKTFSKTSGTICSNGSDKFNSRSTFKSLIQTENVGSRLALEAPWRPVLPPDWSKFLIIEQAMDLLMTESLILKVGDNFQIVAKTFCRPRISSPISVTNMTVEKASIRWLSKNWRQNRGHIEKETGLRSFVAGVSQQ